MKSPEPVAGVAPSAPNARAWAREAQRLAESGCWEEAIACYEQALARDSQNAQACHRMGLCLAALGRLEEAIAGYDRALAMDPRMAEAWFSKALAEEKIGRTQNAIRAYKRYIAVGVDQGARQIEYARQCLRDLGCEGVTREGDPSADAPKASLDQAPGHDQQHGEQVQDAQRPGRVRHDREDRAGPSQPFEPVPSPPKPQRPRRAAGAAAGGYKKGDRIGEFEVQGVLGRGGFGVVYLVHLPTPVDIAALGTFRDEDLPSRGLPSDRYVTYALKTLHDPYLAVPEVRKRFRHEAQMLVDLERHPHIVQADFVDEIEGRLYVATEYVAPNALGLNSLEGYLQRQPPDLALSLHWAIQICYGMEYARNKGLRCHRDLKPANILITRDRRVKVADFGLAGVLEQVRLADGIQVHAEDGRIGLSAQTAEGAGFGTPTHMPPEQFTNAASCDERSDIYAFGVVLYQMASRGRLPFLATPPRDGSAAERRRFLADMHRLHGTAPVPALDSPLSPVIGRCLAKEPAQRYQSFAELREALEPLLRRETGEVAQAPSAGQLTAGEWHIKGYSLAAMGLWEKAIECYDRSLALEPNHAQTWTNKGRCLAALEQREEAIECYDRAVDLNPLLADAWNNKGVALDHLGQRDEAIVCFDRALSLNPQYAESWSNKATSLLDLGRQQEAISCIDRALELSPENAMMWNNKGQLLTGLGYWEEALTCFDRALALNPRLAEAWSCRAETLSYLGNREEAIDCCDRALVLDPRHTVALNNKGANLSALGRRKEAIACYDWVLTLNPQDAVAWNNKANNLVALDRADEAMACYERAVALDPEYAHAWFNKAATEDRLGRRRDAARSYERFLTVASAQDMWQIQHARNRLLQLGSQ
jgi:tetratricopeptide (TPR) repeat protein